MLVLTFYDSAGGLGVVVVVVISDRIIIFAVDGQGDQLFQSAQYIIECGRSGFGAATLVGHTIKKCS